MKPAMLCCLVLLSLGPLSAAPGRIAYFDEKNISEVYTEQLQSDSKEPTDIFGTYGWDKQELTPMEALDLIKAHYADNFNLMRTDREEDYYYKLDAADYYLTYEGPYEKEQYLFRLYEFVLDDPIENIGHTVTYGWYAVDKSTGRITEQ